MPNKETHWARKRKAFTTFNELHRAYKEAEETRSLILYECIDDILQQEELDNPELVPTMKRYGLRLRRSDPCDEWVALINRRGMYASSWDIPVFGRKRQKTYKTQQ